MPKNPRIILQGVQDASVPKRTPVPESNPIHLPLLYVQTASGPELAFISPEDDYESILGSETFNARGKLYNHQTALLEMMLKEGNTCLVKRITRPLPVQDGNDIILTNVPAKASMTLLCDMDYQAVVHPFIRNADGSVAVDSLGAARVLTAQTINGGVVLKFHMVATKLFTPQALASGMVTYQNRQMRPLFTFDHNFIGKSGENTGIRLWSANSVSPTPADIDVVNNQQALLYGAQIVTRKNSYSSPTVNTSLLGETYITFGLPEGVYNHKTDKDLKLESLVENWSDDGAITGFMPIWGPLGGVKTYYENIDYILEELQQIEQFAIDQCESYATVIPANATDGVPVVPTQGSTAPAPASKYMIDMLSGVNYNNIPFYGFRVDNSGATFSNTRTYYLLDGHDGDLSNETYETEIVNQIENYYNDTDFPLISSAKYPWSALYDTGFGNDVKRALFKWTSYRKNVHVTAGTYVVGEDPFTVADEVSASNTLRGWAMQHAESSVFGTPAFRGVLFMQSGFLTNSKYKKRVPNNVFELALKRARSLGAGNGIVKEGSSYNTAPGNVLEISKGVTCQYLQPVAEALVWANGLNSAAAFDKKALFYPSIQTVYGVEESVLIGEFYMQVTCDVESMIERTWRYMVNSDITPEKFAEESNRVFNSFVKGKYDNRVVITANTFFTPLDTENGYSWHIEVTVAGSVPKTVATASIIATRRIEA